MSATVLDIADAVVSALNAASLSQSFTAERAYVPVHKRDDLADLAVTVVPATIRTTLLDRTPRHSHDYAIDVGIQQAIDPIPVNLDPLVALAEEIMDLFRGRTLSTYTAAKCTDAQNDPIYVPTHIDDHQVFTSVIRLTFTVVR